MRGVFAVADWPLDATLDTSGPDSIVERPVVIDVDLTEAGGFSRVKAKLKYHKAGRVALLRTHNRRAILRAHELGAGGLLHDVGKAQIPNGLLNKAGPISSTRRY